MNTICQDRDITAGVFEHAGIDPHGHALARTRRALDKARNGPHRCDRAHIGAQQQVGKTPLEVGKLLPTGFSWQTVSNLIPL
jgi:hypothetical protein